MPRWSHRFLDLILHGMDGCEVARQLRGHPELEGLALIALSGNGDDESRRRAIEAGFDKYLSKPIDVAVLIETLNCLPRNVRPSCGSVDAKRAASACSDVERQGFGVFAQ